MRHRSHGTTFKQMRMTHDFWNGQHRRHRHPLMLQRSDRGIAIRQRLQPSLNFLDKCIFMAHAITDSAKTRILRQPWLSHRSKEPLPLMIKSSNNEDITLPRAEYAARR